MEFTECECHLGLDPRGCPVHGPRELRKLRDKALIIVLRETDKLIESIKEARKKVNDDLDYQLRGYVECGLTPTEIENKLKELVASTAYHEVFDRAD